MTNREDMGATKPDDRVAASTAAAGMMVLDPAPKPVAEAPNAAADRLNIAPPLCANCGARVHGHYCSQCGQRVEHSVHSIWHFAREATEDLTHADSRLWRTLVALLFKPGFLTREFLAGRRVSYLPPLRLYLVLSVAFFLIAALSGTGRTRLVLIHYDNPASISTAQLRRETTESLLQQKAKTQDCARWKYTGPWQSRLGPALRTSCERALQDDGRELGEAFLHYLPRALFLMVPALALLMKPLYWRPRRYYIEHLLFVLHDHAFVFALLGSSSIVAAVLRPIHVPVDPLEWGIVCYIPCYYYVAMRRVYGQSPARTLGKLTVLALGYLVTAIFVLLATGLYTVLAQ